MFPMLATTQIGLNYRAELGRVAHFKLIIFTVSGNTSTRQKNEIKGMVINGNNRQ